MSTVRYTYHKQDSRLPSQQPTRAGVYHDLGTAVFRARTMERLQFITVLLGFILILYSKVTSRAIWYRIGIGTLYCEIFIVCMLLFTKSHVLLSNKINTLKMDYLYELEGLKHTVNYSLVPAAL